MDPNVPKWQIGANPGRLTRTDWTDERAQGAPKGLTGQTLGEALPQNVSRGQIGQGQDVPREQIGQIQDVG